MLITFLLYPMVQIIANVSRCCYHWGDRDFANWQKMFCIRTKNVGEMVVLRIITSFRICSKASSIKQDDYFEVAFVNNFLRKVRQ